ncbi:THAP domain-containing protein 3 isoform X2 [Neomonachus schauinslandi]|uniref:THAP domain-containing protein 3 isoform X2 n=1 Tax=Neomonachus schauinslandi TaxID=29088 RepID=A0A2Y9GJ33_NEOSC|nr:THAP domain-containing protein 3 isoform X2 [Neomonachus schauinslandi]
MPKSCAARQCCNRYSSRRKQLTFHRFPFSRPELLKEWVLNIGRGNFKPKQHTVICSEHFRPECFSAFGNRKNLKQNAVPTVFAFQDAAQLVRQNADPAGGGAHVDSYEEVVPEAGPAEGGLGRRTASALEVLPPSAGGATEQGLLQRPQGTPAPGQPASPTQPSDHSYALLDLDALKTKLFLTLKENEKLRKRLKAQRLVMQRMSGRLRAHRAGQPGPQSRAGRPGFPVSASGARAVAPEATVRQARPTTSHLRGGVAASARDRSGTVGRTGSVLPEGTGPNCPSTESWAGVFSTTA